MAKKLLKEEDVPGRTVNRIVQVYDAALVIHFTDDTCLAIEATHSYDSTELNVVTELDRWKAFHGAVITEEENAKLEAAEAAASRQRQAEYDRQQYERLKAQFERTP